MQRAGAVHVRAETHTVVLLLRMLAPSFCSNAQLIHRVPNPDLGTPTQASASIPSWAG